MRPLIVNAVLLGLVSLTAVAQESQPAPAGPSAPVIVIRVGTLIDGKAEAPRRNQVIVVRGHRIEAVSDAAGFKTPAGATVIDLSRATVLPGLIDSHTHILIQGEDPAEGGYDANILKQGMGLRVARATASLRRALEQGFTTLRDVDTEGAGYADVGLKQAVEQGYIPGPRLFVSTLSISSTGGYPLEDYAPEIDVPKGAQLVDGPVEARKAAREQLDHGADWIKVYMTHRSWVGANGELVSQPTLTLEEAQAIVEETHGWGRKVACHAYGGLGLHRALEAGCDSIEHGLDLDDAAIAQMVKQGTWYCPTLAAYFNWWEPENTPSGRRDRKRAEVHVPSFQKALRAGVKIAFGSDVGGFKWSDPIAQEFEKMVEYGMSPMAAIQSATSRAAEMLDQEGRLGVIAPGAYADIIAVAGDPLQDISELKRVRFVMKDGSVFKNDLR